MVRLTTELVAKAPSYINPIKDRELDLRGKRIPQIEHLGVSKVKYSKASPTLPAVILIDSNK
jgi:Leucine-rich repeat